MVATHNGKLVGSLQRDLSFLKNFLDFRLTKYPRFYLYVEDRRGWVNWDKRVYLSFIRRGDLVLDVGANVGAHTVFFSHLVGPDGRVLAFEPLPPNVDALRETLRRRARYDNVSVFATAVGGTTSDEQVAISAPGTDLTQASLRRQSAGSWEQQEIQSYTVAVTSIDAERAVEEERSVDFIKIDVEGAELDVIQGGAKTITRHHPVLYCELYTKWIATFGHAPADLIHFVHSIGYSGARVISRRGVDILPLNSDPPSELFETSSDVLFFTDKHRELVTAFDRRYLR